ncbi:retinol dehydrogenase 13-like isoform X2 [Cylas formicarius]|uniref:retinol dehydrogenase 13-like isoform X2 n=1 Tax=Cylas formicarius TaxID=197179 RepID=UPI0029583614|nr:retinol dehydrogenase 13-like isoform X2 [Cylas formicarius]
MHCLYSLFFWIALGLVCFRIYLKLMTGWCRSQVCLVGKTALVTGANTGIGYETALDFAKRGATVILACRDESKARKARDNIIEETNNKNVSYGLVDFLDLACVRKFADEFNSTHTRLDILVNNAAAVRLRGVTTDGYLAAVQVNYLGPFLLTMLLLNLIVKTPSARIVNVSSSAPNYSNPLDMDLMFDGPDRTKAYYRSKFGNILFTIELASRLANTTVTVYSLHPGVVDTDIFRRLPPSWKFVMDYIVRWFMKVRRNIQKMSLLHDTKINTSLSDLFGRRPDDHLLRITKRDRVVFGGAL